MVKYSNQSYNLHVELDTKHCELSEPELLKMHGNLDTLVRVIDKFPVAGLYVTVIHHARSGDFHVKTSLVLTGRTLFTGDRDVEVHPAYTRCLRKLVNKVEAYRASLERAEETSKLEKGTYHDVLPTALPAENAIRESAEEGDYAAFRRACDGYAEPLRKRVGRWVQRYPEVQSQIGESLQIADVVDEVFLNAFEQFEQRPRQVPFHEWLEKLVDPSIVQLLRHPDEEMENISFARSLLEGEG